MLSRMRAGSLPQRAGGLSNSSPFGPSVFSTSWTAARDRANTHTGNHSFDPTSPSDSAFQRDFSDIDVKTLDYLGLDDRNYHSTNNDVLSPSYNVGGYPSSSSSIQPLLANFSGVNRSNRFRSYSVNAKEKYAADEQEGEYPEYYSGTITPSAEYAAAALAATHAEIHQHNLEVQAFANQASSSRPRARTAGVLDKPSSRMWRGFGGAGGSRLGLADTVDTQGLADAVQAMQLQNAKAALMGDFDGDTVAESTRALWLGGIPTSTTPSSLKAIFEAFGKIESARVLTHKSCGFVNFENVESAVRAKSQYNGKEIFPGAGPVRIGYAKAPSASGTPAGTNRFPSPTPDHQYAPSKSTGTASPASRDRAFSSASKAPDVVPSNLRDIRPEIMAIVRELGATDEDQIKIKEHIEKALSFDDYQTEIPAIPEPSQNRMFDAPKLRDIRKRIDNNSCNPMEIEELAMSMLPEIAELSSDYLGNTVIQKLFEFCSESVKESMLREIAPHLAEIGVHKNGTWAAQKIIDVTRTPQQMSTIVEHVQPYAMASFLDQYGNYVMQCCLRFAAPYNSFVFDAMLSRLWPIAQGRFGARAMRACLESHHATKDQQRMIAAAIALHSVQLATNANGALLLTWFLDTCNFPQRRKVLAPRLIPHLVHLCTHKVAYLTVLKIINQRNEPEARDSMLQALFFSSDDHVLEQILADQACGATLIYKVLTTPFFEDSLRSRIIENVRKVLIKIKAQPSQGYKRLMDEVGLPTRGNAAAGRDTAHRESSNTTPTAPGATNVPGGPYAFPPGIHVPNQRSVSDSSLAFPGGAPTIFQPTAQSALHMQQAMLAQGRDPMGYAPAAGAFGNGDPYRGMARPGMPQQTGFGSMDPNAMMQTAAGFHPTQQFGQGPVNGWQQAPQQFPNGYIVPQQAMHGQVMMGNGNGNHRGRVSTNKSSRGGRRIKSDTHFKR